MFTHGVFVPLFLQNIIDLSWDQDPQLRPSAKSIEIKFIKDSHTFLRGTKNQMLLQYEHNLSQFISSPLSIDYAKFVNSIPQLSSKGKQLAISYISIQEHILGVSFENYNQVLQWLVDHIDPNKGKIHLLHFFMVASKCRFKTLEIISRLLAALGSKFVQLKDLPQLFMDESFDIMMKTEPLPSMTGPLNLLYYLVLHNSISKQEIVQRIKLLF